MGSSTLPDTDESYFPRGRSVLRRVMNERAVGLLYGQRALMVGAMHPLAFIGTTQRSTAHDKPWKRLTHTAKMFDAVFFGTREEADKALAFTHRLHERVKGTIPEAAGPWPAGSPYSAFDPELMLWVVAPMFDSAQVLHDTLVRRLSDEEREELWQEYLLFGELFGMPRSAAPASVAELDAWWEEQFASEEVFLTEEARAVGTHIAFKIPVPAHLRPGMSVAAFILAGTLPEPVREEYGISWRRSDELAFRALTTSVRASRRFVPSGIRRGPSAKFYELVAQTERRQLRAGKPSFEGIEERRPQRAAARS